MKWLNRIFYIVNLLSLFPLALSYLAPYISPNSFLWPLAFLGLLYPIFLIINTSFMLYWLVTFKRYFWSNLVIILILRWVWLDATVRIFVQVVTEFNILSPVVFFIWIVRMHCVERHWTRLILDTRENIKWCCLFYHSVY